MRPGAVNRAAESPSADQHLLKPASGQAILPRYRSRDCHHPVAVLVRDGGESRAMKVSARLRRSFCRCSRCPPTPRASGRKARKKGQADDRPKVDEKAYKAALERIPEPKEKYDPWAVAKPAEPAKKPK